jgi:hypothetical protein
MLETSNASRQRKMDLTDATFVEGQKQGFTSRTRPPRDLYESRQSVLDFAAIHWDQDVSRRYPDSINIQHPPSDGSSN